MEFLVSEGMSEGTWPFLGQKNSRKISSGPTSGESSISRRIFLHDSHLHLGLLFLPYQQVFEDIDMVYEEHYFKRHLLMITSI